MHGSVSRVSHAPPPVVMLRSCEDCGAPLLLVSTVRAPVGAMARLYGCSSCRHLEKVTTNAKWLGWINSELRPPA
jgi:hypothetical protein